MHLTKKLNILLMKPSLIFLDFQCIMWGGRQTLLSTTSLLWGSFWLGGWERETFRVEKR